MPAQTLDQVKKQEEGLAKSLADLGESATPAELRAARKRLRRAQRRRRRMVVEAERLAAMAPKTKAKTVGAPAEAEAPVQKESAE